MNQNEKAQTGDSIISELHRTREAMVEKFGGDLAALTADAKQRQEESGRKIISRPTAPAKPTQVGK